MPKKEKKTPQEIEICLLHVDHKENQNKTRTAYLIYGPIFLTYNTKPIMTCLQGLGPHVHFLSNTK